MRNIFFSSDHHFDHANIIQYCNRPFASVKEMNAELIKRWNAVVQPDDIIYYLGDFSLSMKTLQYVKQLNGIKILIPGNHDKCFRKHKNFELKAREYLDAGFTEILLEDISYWFDDLEQLVSLSHFPYQGFSYDERYKNLMLEDNGNWLLCGHVHEKWKTKAKMINVGCDVWNYAPVSITEIKTLMQTKENFDETI